MSSTQNTTPQTLGTDTIRWDLTAFYPSHDAPEITADIADLIARMAAYAQQFRGKLTEPGNLGLALTADADLTNRQSKIFGYFGLAQARDSTNAALRQAASRAEETLTMAHAEHLTFSAQEMAKLPEDVYQRELASDAVVQKHQPLLDHLRAQAAYFLPDEVEKALTQRGPYGPNEWDDMLHELETELRFTFNGEEKLFAEMLHIVAEDPSPAQRAEALRVVNSGLASQRHTYFQARALNVMLGDKLTDDTARGYAHPMAARNLANQVDDATVTALHTATGTTGAQLAQRFYRLKARLLGLKTLDWSDRNAPMPFVDARTIPYPEACTQVAAAYHAFSPTLRGLADQVLDQKNGWVDAPPAKTKSSGAFDMTLTLPKNSRFPTPSYMLLNYLGTPRDVATLAHELGHAVHGLLAVEAQGPLMWHAPMPYAETASIFGEMLVFENTLAETTDPKLKLGLLMDKINDGMNSVVRQISFSHFEQAIFAQRPNGKLSADDFSKIWSDLLIQFYGPEGDVFTYKNSENLWCYISHFHNPFYVYAYAFGELFTQSLMAARPSFTPVEFESLYLDLLRAGGTQGAVELLAPFGLNPNDPDFWEKGLTASLGTWLTEAESLANSLKL